MAAWPTIPAAPWMRTPSPFEIWPVSCSTEYAVVYARGMDAASVQDKESGSLAKNPAVVRANDLMVPRHTKTEHLITRDEGG